MPPKTPFADRSSINTTSAPTATDDANAGWDVGSRWINTVTGVVYFCVDTTPGAAVWKDVSTPGAGSHPVTVSAVDPTATDDSNAGFSVGDHWINSTSKEIFQLADASVGAAVWQVVSRRPIWDAVVAPSNGDYTLPSAAFAAGAKRVWMRQSTYAETADVVIPDGGHLEAEAGTVIDFAGGSFQVIADGNGGTTETAGTFAVTQGSTAVVGTGTTFTNLSPGDYLFIGPNAYEIDTITDDTNLDLVEAWQGPARSGLAMFGTTMYSDILLANFTILNSIDPNSGLFLRAVRSMRTENVVVEGCTHNVLVEDSADSFFDNLISRYSTNDGLKISSSRSIQSAECLLGGNLGNGATVDGGLALKFNDCEFSANAGAGARVQNATTDATFNACGAKQNNGIGIEAASGTARCLVTGGTAEFNGSHGVDLQGTENAITGCEIGENGGYGARSGSASLITGCQLNDNTSHGINGTGVTDSVFVGNDITDNGGDGILLATSDDVTVAANRIRDNTGNGITIPATGVSRTRLLANNVSGHTTDYSIAAGAGGDTTIFNAEYTGNDLTGPVLHNTSSLVPPTAVDDRTLGYQKGSLWLDTSEKDLYICIDSTATSALWLQVNSTENQTRDTPKESFYGSLLDYPVSAGNTAGEIQYVRVFLLAQFEFVSIRCFVDSGGTAARDVRMGIYDQVDPLDPAQEPNNLVASTLASATGDDNGTFKTVALQSAFTVPTTGYYWLAIVQNSASLKLASSATFRAEFLPVRRESGSGTNLPATAGTLSNPVAALVYVAAVET